MKTFKVNDTIEIVCEWKKTRSAFKHEATLIVNGESVESTKICYLNRTWERYEYESVMKKLVDKTGYLTSGEKKLCLDFINQDNTDRSDFKAIATVAKLGDLFCSTTKEKNDWKTRMLKAGLENKGLIMPEDWDTLSEEEKTSRLNKVIEVLK